MKNTYTEWIIIGIAILVVGVIVMAIVFTNRGSSVSEIVSNQPVPASQPLAWTPSCGKWIEDEHSVLLRLKHNYNGVIYVRYYPGDRFEVSVPNVGVNTLGFKIYETNGETIDIKARTQSHIQGYDRIEIDNPESVKKLYQLLLRGDFILRTAWLIETKIENEGCGLADFVWHKFTTKDPYTNEILGKPFYNHTATSYQYYDVDLQNGMSSDDVLEHLIRIDLGDADAAEELLNAFIDAL